MNPLVILGLANGALSLLETIMPSIKKLAEDGDITKEQQKVVRDRYDALVDAGDEMFTGPEWQIDP